MKTSLAIAVSFLWLGFGCGSDGASNPDAGGDPVDARAGDGGADAPGYRTDLIGTIQLIEQVGGGNNVFGLLYDRVPEPREHRVDSAGDCALYDHPAPGLCEPACEANSYCTPAGACVPYARRIGAGTIAVAGAAQAFSLIPSDFGYNPEPYPQGDLFAAGSAITVTAPGSGSVPGFAIAAAGVADLADSFNSIDLVDGSDYTVGWTAGGGDARIQLALRTGWHGAPYEMMLLCDTADDGSLTIPQALIEQYPSHGGIGLFPHPSEILRYTRGVAETSAGPIELLVGSQQSVNFTH